MFQQVSISAMLVAVAFSCTEGTFQIVLLLYALLSSLVYVSIVAIGGILPIKALITFEFMLWVSAPVFFFFCCLNSWRYYMLKDTMDLVLLGAWILLIGTMIAYRVYSKQGISKKLWTKGVWFSENDVLHVFLILWMAYITTVVADRITDYTVPSFLL